MSIKQLSVSSLKLSTAKQSLLASLMVEEGWQPTAAAPISRRSPDALSPLSSTQERLWFLSQMEDAQTVYNMPAIFRLVGRIDLPAFSQAIEKLVARHEILRTTFTTVDDHPVQTIHPPAPCHFLSAPPAHPYLFLDLSHLPPEEREAQALHLSVAEGQRPFELSTGPLLRFSLLRLDPTNHFLVINWHHIIADGWSFGVLLDELAAFYTAYTSGGTPDLPEPPLQFADYAAWEREQLAGGRLAGQKAYWQKQLTGSPTLLELPTDQIRPARQSYRGRAHNLDLSATLTRSLHALSQAEGATLFMTLLAAFKVLLFRYTGQTDLVVGTPIANRTLPQTTGLIGPLFNTLAIRTKLDGAFSFRQLLRQVRRVALEAYEHQEFPFAHLIQTLQPTRSLSHAPLFQVLFGLQSRKTSTLELPGLTAEVVDPTSTTAKFDLNLALAEDSQGLTGALEYNTDLFNADTIARLVGHFQMLLDGIVNNPDQPIATLPLLTLAEEHQLRSWNETACDYGQPMGLHEMFERQARQTPHAIAVKAEDERGRMTHSLTYHQLDEQANQLAHYLQEQGIGPETVVGICAERSLALVVGLFGVLKTGAAYLPLDPDYPPDRLAFMISDARIPLLLTQHYLMEKLPSNLNLPVVCLDRNEPIWAHYPTGKPESHIHPDQAAYVIYTSGSTGRPKGVINSHRSIYNRLTWMQSEYNLTSTDKVLQKTPFSFDVSVWEFFWTLATGACLIMSRPGGHKDGDYLVQTIQEQGITTLHFVPSMLQLFLEAPLVDQCHSLQRVFCSGEALPPDLVSRFYAQLEAELHNLYGPTEAAVDVTYWPCPSKGEVRLVPIGWPITNVQIHLLDIWGQPVPVGVPGELYIGGVNVARGYLNRAELTATRFVPDPFADQPGARLYRTGDRARYLPDGAIEYLGRLDFQVKIRGFRIELGEIESALSQHPDVREVVLLVQEDQTGDKRLVAYLVSAGGERPGVTSLRHFLGQHLPEYMIPATFVWLETMPLLANGKVDRKALPIPDQARPQLNTTFISPRDRLELDLAHAWQDVLGLPTIGMRDNFFDLGGHSLLAVRLMARIQKQFGRKLPLSTLFQHNTVEKLAGLLRQDSGTVPRSPLVPIQPIGSRPPLFLVHAAGGTALSYSDLARHLHQDCPLYGLEARGLEGETEPTTNFTVMATDYLTAIRTVQPTGPYHLGGWCVGGTIAFEMARQLVDQGEEVALLVLLDAYAPRGAAANNNPAISEEEWDDTTLYLAFMQGLADHFGKKLSLNPATWQGVPTHELPARVLQKLQQEGILPPDTEVEQIRHYLRVYQCNGLALDAYQPHCYDGPVVLFRAMSEPSRHRVDETLGWCRWLALPPSVYDVPGEHATLLFEPHVHSLAEAFRNVLLSTWVWSENGSERNVR